MPLGFRDRPGDVDVYDVSHNLAKVEEYNVEGRVRKLCVRREGATGAFEPGHSDVPARYRSVGQPVLIPGSMGSASYVRVGTAEAMQKSQPKLLAEEAPHAYKDVSQVVKACDGAGCPGRWRAFGPWEW